MIEYNKEIKICNGRNCGYLYFYDKDHPLSMPNGTVYLHRHVASLKIGHWLSSEEHVHHIDGNKENNDPQNLDVLTNSEHSLIEWINKNGIPKEKMFCNVCGEETSGEKTGLCAKCYSAGTRLFNPSKEELEKLVWEMPTANVAKIFGVSDKAIEKRCKILHIDKPPRGYWQKLNPIFGRKSNYYKNNPDKVKKGGNNPSNKFKESDIISMLTEFYVEKISASIIIEKYNIDKSYFYKVMRGDKWKGAYNKVMEEI